jgi:MFS family permease
MICMVQLLPLSALGTSFPTAEIIATSFNITDPSILPWTVAAYVFTFGTFILIAGRLGDIVGHRTMIVVGFAIMSLSSVLAGLSI